MMLKATLATIAAVVISAAGAAQAKDKDKDKDKEKHTLTAAPEIDPASAISALTLLAGGLAIYRGRRAAEPRS